jgi:hypothetical protein
MEPCLRAVVLSSEILNGWWRRNGIGVMNQAMHYQFMLICEMSYKKDIVMLQVKERERRVLSRDIFLSQWLTK